jgi:hypothetical protein
MAKKNVMVCIDIELYTLCKIKNINLSETINSYLKYYLTNNAEFKDDNINELRIKIKEDEEDIRERLIKIQKLKSEIKDKEIKEAQRIKDDFNKKMEFSTFMNEARGEKNINVMDLK